MHSRQWRQLTYGCSCLPTILTRGLAHNFFRPFHTSWSSSCTCLPLSCVHLAGTWNRNSISNSRDTANLGGCHCAGPFSSSCLLLSSYYSFLSAHWMEPTIKNLALLTVTHPGEIWKSLFVSQQLVSLSFMQYRSNPRLNEAPGREPTATVNLSTVCWTRSEAWVVTRAHLPVPITARPSHTSLKQGAVEAGRCNKAYAVYFTGYC